MATADCRHQLGSFATQWCRLCRMAIRRPAHPKSGGLALCRWQSACLGCRRFPSGLRLVLTPAEQTSSQSLRYCHACCSIASYGISIFPGVRCIWCLYRLRRSVVRFALHTRACTCGLTIHSSRRHFLARLNSATVLRRAAQAGTKPSARNSSRRLALMIPSSLRMHATSATLASLPRARSCW